jgi:hypothetical protein
VPARRERKKAKRSIITPTDAMERAMRSQRTHSAPRFVNPRSLFWSMAFLPERPAGRNDPRASKSRYARAQGTRGCDHVR